MLLAYLKSKALTDGVTIFFNKARLGKMKFGWWSELVEGELLLIRPDGDQ